MGDRLDALSGAILRGARTDAETRFEAVTLARSRLACAHGRELQKAARLLQSLAREAIVAGERDVERLSACIEGIREAAPSAGLPFHASKAACVARARLYLSSRPARISVDVKARAEGISSHPQDYRLTDQAAPYWPSDERERLAEIRHGIGVWALVNIAGTVRVELRLQDALDLLDDEVPSLLSLGEAVTLRCPSGAIELQGMARGPDATLKLSPGSYRVRFVAFTDHRILATMMPADGTDTPPLLGLDALADGESDP